MVQKSAPSFLCVYPFTYKRVNRYKRGTVGEALCLPYSSSYPFVLKFLTQIIIVNITHMIDGNKRFLFP